jgi:hypothetical protein
VSRLLGLKPSECREQKCQRLLGVGMSGCLAAPMTQCRVDD